MRHYRNKTLRKQILERDLYLCQACGFKADEVHHIKPLCMGGTDEAKNMISLCSFCHKHAPDTKNEFIDYIKYGGAKLEFIIGRVINRSIKDDELLPNKLTELKRILNLLKSIDYNYIVENFNTKKWLNTKIDNCDLNYE